MTPAHVGYRLDGLDHVAADWQRRQQERAARPDGQCVYEDFLRASGVPFHDMWARHGGDVHARWCAFAAVLPREYVAACRAYPNQPSGEEFGIPDGEEGAAMARSLLKLRRRELAEMTDLVEALLAQPPGESRAEAAARVRAWIEHRKPIGLAP